jgi:hypothetical protein
MYEWVRGWDRWTDGQMGRYAGGQTSRDAGNEGSGYGERWVRMRWKDGLGYRGETGQNLRRISQDAATGGLGCCNKWVRMQGHLCKDAVDNGPGNVR